MSEEKRAFKPDRPATTVLRKNPRLRICRAITSAELKQSSNSNAGGGVCRPAVGNFLAINPLARSFLRTYIHRVALPHNAIKLSAKTIIYPDPAVPRNEGKWVEVINTTLRVSRARASFRGAAHATRWIKGKDLWRVGGGDRWKKNKSVSPFSFFCCCFALRPRPFVSFARAAKNRLRDQSYGIRLGTSVTPPLISFRDFHQRDELLFIAFIIQV